MALCGVGALLGDDARRCARSAPRRAAWPRPSPSPRSAPLALGSVILYRYDLWPAALAVAGLAAVLAGRERLGFASLGLGIAAKVFPAVLAPAGVRLRLADARPARGAALPRRVRRRPCGRDRAVPGAGAARSLEEHRAPDDPAASDREPRRGAPARGAPGRRARDHDGVEPRLAEPRRLAAARAGDGLDRVARRHAGRHLGRGGAGACDP